MGISIKQEPDIPPELAQDAAAGKIVPFIGAGVSRLAGGPSWDQLAEKALTHLVKMKLLSYAELQHIRQQPFRTQLSIAQRISLTKKVPIPYADFLPCDFKHELGVRLYSAISRLGNRFVTTNYDQWLDYEFVEPPTPTVAEEGPNPATKPKERTVVFKEDELELGKFQEGAVMHLHGSVRDPYSMTLSTDDYLRRYASDRRGGPENKCLTFLDHLFNHHSVLFIGYGVEEPEVLEYLLLKHTQYRGTSKPERRYVLAPFFSYEEALAGHLRDYWRGFGVEVIPFLRDHNNFEQLVHVVEGLAKNLPRPSAAKLQRLAEMEGLLNE